MPAALRIEDDMADLRLASRPRYFRLIQPLILIASCCAGGKV
jgi:hypothetical protein